MLICYADDCGLWYPITEANQDTIIDAINQDLEGLRLWGLDNHIAFEPTKTHFTLMSKKTSHKFDPVGIIFDGVPIAQESQVKLVGYTFDEKMSFGPMIKALANKARSRLGMMTRLRGLLDDQNMKTMHCAFIRPIMEYGSVVVMGAKQTHFTKFDQIQTTAAKIGRFEVESLSLRREAAAIALTCKLLDGKGRGVLKTLTPSLVQAAPIHRHNTSTTQKATGLQLVSLHKTNSLDLFRDSYLGSFHKIWTKLPQSLIMTGQKHGWVKITRRAKGFLTGKWETEAKKEKKKDLMCTVIPSKSMDSRRIE